MRKILNELRKYSLYVQFCVSRDLSREILWYYSWTSWMNECEKSIEGIHSLHNFVNCIGWEFNCTREISEAPIDLEDLFLFTLGRQES